MTTATAPTTATPYEPILSILKNIADRDLDGDLVQYISFVASPALINAAKLTLARVREEDEDEAFQPIFVLLQYIGDTTPGKVGHYSFILDTEIIYAASITLVLVRRVIEEVRDLQEGAQLLYEGPLNALYFLDLQSKCVRYKVLTGMPVSLKRADGTVATLGKTLALGV